jgi:Holliday junction resolvasome RuvABC endonuclease subunit
VDLNRNINQPITGGRSINIMSVIGKTSISLNVESKILLALDPASSTGYCLVEVCPGKWANIYEYGFIDVECTSDYQGDHCIDLMTKLQTIIDDHHVDEIAVEAFFYSKKYAQGCEVNQAFRTAIHILSRQNNIPYTILNISAWKTFIAGRANPTKDQRKVWGVARAKKIYIQEALWNVFSIRFPNHSISTKTNKPISFRYDIVDVVAQAIYYCCMFSRTPLHEIWCDVEVPDDVPIRTKKPMFEYV